MRKKYLKKKILDKGINSVETLCRRILLWWSPPVTAFSQSDHLKHRSLCRSGVNNNAGRMQNLLWKPKETRYFEEIYWSHCWKSHKILYKVDHHSWISTKSLWKCSWSSRCRQIIGWRVLSFWLTKHSKRRKDLEAVLFSSYKKPRKETLRIPQNTLTATVFPKRKGPDPTPTWPSGSFLHQFFSWTCKYFGLSIHFISSIFLLPFQVILLLPFFFIIKCSFEMFFETLLGLNTYCFIILIFKVLKIINCQINYMIIATAFSKIFVFFIRIDLQCTLASNFHCYC